MAFMLSHVLFFVTACSTTKTHNSELKNKTPDGCFYQPEVNRNGLRIKEQIICPTVPDIKNSPQKVLKKRGDSKNASVDMFPKPQTRSRPNFKDG